MLLVFTTLRIDSQEIADMDLFLQPLKMTETGLQFFFRSLYNSQRYTQDFFPHDFSHLMQFLAHGKQSAQDVAYTRATLSLFSQKIKGSLYLSAYIFSDFLKTIPVYVEYHFPVTRRTAESRDAVKKLLYDEFLNNFEAFKDNPSAFLGTLSDKVVNLAEEENMRVLEVEKMRQGLVRFIELGLSKVLWDATDIDLWNHAKEMGEMISALELRGIVTDADDISSMLWSLVYRLAYFVDIAGSQLPASFYQNIQKDFSTSGIALLNYPETEELAQTRKEFLSKTILKAYARKEAEQFGMVV